jgi:hypothetical protein
MRWSTICVVLFFLGLGKTFAQTMGSPNAETACALADGKQMSLRYTEIPGAGKQDLPMGKVWTPGNASMDLFTQADVLTGKTEIPVGAYSTYIIPDKRSWTFIINKNVAADGKSRITGSFAYFAQRRGSFSAALTVWRREKDSNSRYRFCHAYKRPCFRDLPRFNLINEQTREADCGRP